MEKFQTFVDFFQEYAKTFEKMVIDEKNKLQGLISNDIKAIEQNISIQQANNMRLNNIEMRRMELLEDMGMEDATFKQVIESFEGEDKLALEKLYNRVNDAIGLIKYYNAKSMDLVNMNMNMLHGKNKSTTDYNQLYKK